MKMPPSTLFCICCFERQSAYISVLNCSHTDFLKNHPIMEIKLENQVICDWCHNMLKKIKLFQQQVEESLKLLSSHEIKPESSYKKPTLQVYKMENIDISDNLEDNNTNTIKVEIANTTQNSTIEKTAIGNSTTGITSTKNSTTGKNMVETTKSTKLKNIENALKIINNNQKDVCMTFLAASLQNLSKSLLSDNLNILNNMNLFSQNISGLNQKNNSENTSKINLDDSKNKVLDIKKSILKNSVTVNETNGYKKRRHKLLELKMSLSSKIKKITISRDELMEERLQTAASHTYFNSLHRCENCIVGFYYAENLEDHIKRKHSPKQDTLNCDVCLQSLNPGSSYDYHISRHFTRFECIVCNRRFSSLEVAIFHYNTKHCTSVRYKCKNCPYITPIKNNLRNHFRSHTVGKISSAKR